MEGLLSLKRPVSGTDLEHLIIPQAVLYHKRDSHL